MAVILNRLPFGDWRSHDWVEHHPYLGEDLNLGHDKVADTASRGNSSSPGAEDLMLMHRRGLDWTRMGVICELHRGATVHGDTFDVVEFTITGSISLACHTIGHMLQLSRASLRYAIFK